MYSLVILFTPPPPCDIYMLSLHDALPILDDLKHPRYLQCVGTPAGAEITNVLFGESGADVDVAELVNEKMPEYQECLDRKSTRLNSSHLVISYAVFCLKKKNQDFTCRILA